MYYFLGLREAVIVLYNCNMLMTKLVKMQKAFKIEEVMQRVLM